MIAFMVLGGSWRRQLVVVAALAAAARLWAVHDHAGSVSGDEVTYLALANSLYSGGAFALLGEPNATFTPAYPAFLAGVMSVFRPVFHGLLGAQVLLGTLAVVLAAVVTRRIAGVRAGIVAALLFATYPALVWLPYRLLSENLALPLLVASLGVSMMVLDTWDYRTAALLGLLLGLGMLARAAGVLVAMTLIIAILLSSRSGVGARRTLGATAVATLVAMLTVAPWLYRNYRVYGRPTSLTTAAGLTLYSSYWPPLADGRRIWGNVATAHDPAVHEAYSSGNDAAASDALAATTRQRLLRDPLLPLRLAPEKLVHCLVPLDWEILPHPQGSSRSINWAYPPIVILAAIGAWIARRAGMRHLWVVTAPAVAVLVQVLVFYGSPRFRLMSEPSLLILASIALISRKGALPPDADSGDR
jgi:hypothetical protein